MCSKCKEIKSLYEFGKGKLKDGTRSECKDCVKSYGKRYREKLGKLLTERNKRWAENNRDLVKEYARKNRLKYKAKIAIKNLMWRKANLSKEKVRLAESYIRRKNLIYHKLKKNERNRRKNFPEYYSARVSLRNANKLTATPSWANMFYISEAYHLCKLRNHIFDFKWHVDHIVPLKNYLVCGLHSHTNLQVIPAIDNIIKGNRLI